MISTQWTLKAKFEGLQISTGQRFIFTEVTFYKIHILIMKSFFFVKIHTSVSYFRFQRKFHMRFVNTNTTTTMNTMVVTMNTPMMFTLTMGMVTDMGEVLEVGEEVLEGVEVLEVSPLEGEGEVLEVDLSRNHSIQVLNLKLKGKKVQKFSRNLLIQKLKLQELQCKENPLIKRPYLIHLVSQKMNKNFDIENHKFSFHPVK